VGVASPKFGRKASISHPVPGHLPILSNQRTPLLAAALLTFFAPGTARESRCAATRASVSLCLLLVYGRLLLVASSWLLLLLLPPLPAPLPPSPLALWPRGMQGNSAACLLPFVLSLQLCHLRRKWSPCRSFWSSNPPSLASVARPWPARITTLTPPPSPCPSPRPPRPTQTKHPHQRHGHLRHGHVRRRGPGAPLFGGLHGVFLLHLDYLLRRVLLRVQPHQGRARRALRPPRHHHGRCGHLRQHCYQQ